LAAIFLNYFWPNLTLGYNIHITLPKNAKSHFGCLCPLGVKISSNLEYGFLF
jgi:hypothetical protein